jgi:hypothetical protein
MDAHRTAIEERIQELLRYRGWLRETGLVSLKDYLWPEFRAELRALVKVARRARKAERVDSRGDHFAGMPVTFAGFSRVPGPTDAELREETRADRELMRDELHGRDIDGSVRW